MMRMTSRIWSRTPHVQRGVYPANSDERWYVGTLGCLNLRSPLRHLLQLCGGEKGILTLEALASLPALPVASHRSLELSNSRA